MAQITACSLCAQEDVRSIPLWPLIQSIGCDIKPEGALYSVFYAGVGKRPTLGSTLAWTPNLKPQKKSSRLAEKKVELPVDLRHCAVSSLMCRDTVLEIY